MPRKQWKVHVVRVRKAHVDKQGRRREYVSAYLRRTYREGGAVRNETVANLSMLPAEAVDAIEATLKGARLLPVGGAVTITRSLPHGHVAAVAAMAHQLGLPALLGPACRARDIAVALIVSRVLRPGSKLSTLAWWGDTTLGVDLGVAGACTDEIYAAMDWLADRQEAIEKKLTAKHLAPDVNPGRMALFDLTSAWVTGRCWRAGRARLLPGRQEGLRADRVRGAHRPGRPPGRGAGVRRQHRRPGRVRRDRHRHPRHAGHRAAGAGGRSRHDHLRAHRRAAQTQRQPGHRNRFRVDHRAARTRDRQTRRRRRPIADEPVRHPGPRRDQPPRLPRRTVDRLPQPRAGGRTRPQTLRAAGRDRQGTRPYPRPGRRRHPGRGGQDRESGRQGHREIQDGQALPPRHHRHHLHLPSRPGRHRRRSRAGRHLRATHQRRHRHPRPRRGGGKLQKTSPTSNATSASSKPTTWTCDPSTTASTSGSAHTC